MIKSLEYIKIRIYNLIKLIIYLIDGNHVYYISYKHQNSVLLKISEYGN